MKCAVSILIYNYRKLMRLWRITSIIKIRLTARFVQNGSKHNKQNPRHQPHHFLCVCVQEDCCKWLLVCTWMFMYLKQLRLFGDVYWVSAGGEGDRPYLPACEWQMPAGEHLLLNLDLSLSEMVCCLRRVVRICIVFVISWFSYIARDGLTHSLLNPVE